MSHQSSTVTDRIRNTVDQWINTRLRECIHCRDCGSEVSPWDEVCPTCGSGAPAKVAWSAGLVLFVAFVLLLIVVAIGVWLF